MNLFFYIGVRRLIESESIFFCKNCHNRNNLNNKFMSKKDLFEIGATQSSAKTDNHKVFIEKLERNGYTIQSQEKDEEIGINNELIARTLETIMSPPTISLPFIKLEAKEVFGYYDYEEQVFEPLENPKFEFSAYNKGAKLHNSNDPWDKFDLS